VNGGADERREEPAGMPFVAPFGRLRQSWH
jgi:hypothetical protein